MLQVSKPSCGVTWRTSPLEAYSLRLQIVKYLSIFEAPAPGTVSVVDQALLVAGPERAGWYRGEPACLGTVETPR